MDSRTNDQDGVENFGMSVAIYAQQMVVGSFNGDVFTYKLDQGTNTWKGNGRFSVPVDIYTSVSIYMDVLVVTFKDEKNNPDVCGIVYKLTTANNNQNSSNLIWTEIVRLTTKNDPMTSVDQHHYGVSVDENMVFIGRWDEDDQAFGKVFVHDLTNYNN